MKLLITPDTDSEEFKDRLGFLDADFEFKNIETDFIQATGELVEIIGKKVYEYIANNYEAQIDDPDYEDLDENLIRAAQSAIYTKAYILYAPTNDLSHTNDGRKMRNEEHEKNAFQWMIDADNENLEKRYYRSLNHLIKLLDGSKTESETANTIYTIWTTSDEYKATQSLFIRDMKEFSKFVVIDSAYLFIKLCPGIEECETDEIIPRIGKTKFDALKTKLKTPSETFNADELALLKLIRNACANYAFAYGIERFAVSLLPDAVVQKYSSDRSTTKASAPALKMEPQAAIQAYMKSFEKAVSKIEDMLKELPEDLSTLPTLPIIPDVYGGFNC